MAAMRGLCRKEEFKKDKGYAWVVLVLSMISHSLHIGFGPAIVGNLTIAHKSVFDINLQQSGLISTVHVAAIFLFGPIASFLVDKLGCRITAISGGVCFILGLGLSSLSTQPWHAFLLYGVLAGIGIPCLLVSTSEILSMHFEKYKFLAFTLAMLGVNIGMVVWPVLSQKLLDSYGYSKAMLILASFQSINIIVGILLVEPSGAYEERDDTAQSSKTDDNMQESKCHTNLAIVGSVNELDSVRDDTNSTDVSLEEVVKDKRQDEADQEPSVAETKGDTFLLKLKILLKSLQVWLLLINSFLWGANDNSFFVFVNDCILNRTGLTEEEVALGITIVGIANICATVAVVSTSSLKFDRAILNASCVLLFGTTTIAIAFSVNKVMYYSLCAVWGLGEGACIASLLPFICGFCAPNQLSLLFGLVLSVQGIAVVSAAPLVGYISQKFGAEYGLVLSGCFGITAALCILPVVVQRIIEMRNNRVAK